MRAFFKKIPPIKLIFSLYLLNFYFTTLLVVLTNCNHCGGKTGEKIKEYLSVWNPKCFYFVLFYIYQSRKKCQSNFSNLTPRVSLSFWSLLVESIENWILNLIVSLPMIIFSISKEKGLRNKILSLFEKFVLSKGLYLF